MNRAVLPIAIVAALMWSVTASARQFSFDVPSKLVNITFESEMEIEDILGTTHSISGELNLDGGSNAHFKFAVPTKSLRTGIKMRDTHLQGEMWLDAERFPDITFEGSKVQKVDSR
ncbi:MAG: YceI family protein, partial [Deltaproteobacteria bacterium]|nr:YceI family protein [Deltaproteobacteria bacterium]